MSAVVFADLAPGPWQVMQAAVIGAWLAAAVGVVWGGLWLARRVLRRPDQPDDLE